MPKRAIIRKTKSVKGGPRSSGGGTRNNGWNCMIVAACLALIVLGPPAGIVALWISAAAR